MDFKDFTLILTKAAICLNFNLTEQHILTWYEMFFNEKKEDFYAALKALVKQPDRKFFPTVPEVAAALELLKNGQQITPAEAWAKILAYAAQSKHEHEIEQLEANNPTLINAMKQVEYSKIRYADIEKDLPFLKAAFIRAYSAKHAEGSTIERIGISKNENEILQKLGLNKKMGALAA